LTYDAAHQQVVFFGGGNCCGFSNDTWVWDGNNWTRKFPVTNPAVRTLHAMAYDEAHSQIVMIGRASGPVFGETWTWNGTDWTQVSPTGPARFRHAMEYDGTQIVLFAGFYPSLFGDTWGWDGSAWTQKSPASSPPARENHAMVYDKAH